MRRARAFPDLPRGCIIPPGTTRGVCHNPLRPSTLSLSPLAPRGHAPDAADAPRHPPRPPVWKNLDALRSD